MTKKLFTQVNTPAPAPNQSYTQRDHRVPQ
jgi:hypothetical protein